MALFVLALASLCLAEASSNNEALFANRVLSKADIMNEMTMEKALGKFKGIRAGDKSTKQLMDYVQSKLDGSNLRMIEKHKSAPKGYSALDGAKKMLNDMMEEANMKKELEQSKCQEFQWSQEDLMSEARQDISMFNSVAAGARSEVLRAQGQIHVYEEKIPETQKELDEHNFRCAQEIPALKMQLSIVLADLKVMEKILELTKCDDTKSGSFIEEDDEDEANKKPLLLQCKCKNGVAVYSTGDEQIMKMLGQLKSNLVRQYVHQNLGSIFDGLAKSPVFLQEAELRNKTFFAPNTLNVTDVPQEVVKTDCVIQNKCSLSTNPECGKLRDRFLNIQAGIEEKKNELSEKLVELEHFCEETRISYEDTIAGMNTKLRDEETALAASTKEQVTAEAQSHHTGAQFRKLEKEYHQEMKTCCINQNNFLSEVCALEKIRGELFKMEGQKIFITDCEVSDWSPDECSKSCGEGIQTLTRKVVVHPNGGTKCPPLNMKRLCNIQKCPVNCEMADWGEWSGCSAECGGGVIERTRKVKVEMANGGKPCEAGSQSETCNIQACDRDCELADWNDWEPCTKMCGKGTQRHEKRVIIPKKGEGNCDKPSSKDRLGYRSCNSFSCSYLVPAGKKLLECKSKVDVVILLDGSGSLRSKGWKASVKMAQELVQTFKGNKEVRMAFQLFSGPRTWGNYRKCTSSNPNVKVDLEKQCGIKWVSHFTDKIEDIEKAIPKLVWPRATTLTTAALAEAMSELTYSRNDANSVVMVITDGKPMSAKTTGRVSKRLQKMARLMWIPVGRNVPKELMKKWASKPKNDNVVIVNSFASLTKSWTINQIVSSVCPKIG